MFEEGAYRYTRTCMCAYGAGSCLSATRLMVVSVLGWVQTGMQYTLQVQRRPHAKASCF